jgi:Protein of unknown function (DUF3575)
MDNDFTINVLGAVLGGLNLTYTRAVGDHVSLGFSLLGLLPLVVPVGGVGGGLEVYLWTDRSLDGFFLGPYLNVTRSFSSGSYLGVTAVVPGFALGYRFLWRSGFNLGLGAGAGYGIAASETDCPEGATCTVVGEGVYPRIILDLGYAF